MITVSILGGPSYVIQYTENMNGQQALELAYNSANNQGDFTYSLQYYGSTLGYLVEMINETYDTFISKYEPYFFWELMVNGIPSQTGIDKTILQDGDSIEFLYTIYNQETHQNPTLQTKFKLKRLAA